MKKLLSIITIILSLAMFYGCDDKDSDAKFIEFTCTVDKYSVATLSGRRSAFIDCPSNKRVIINESTTIIRQRPSCSGFVDARAKDIERGDVLIVRHRAEASDYSVNPPQFVATSIEAYRAECIGGNLD